MATILIVEDHAMSRQMLGTLLKYMGHRVLEAADGAAALELARHERPDLIITDILIPVVDGLAFVHQLRAQKQLERTPVIFYTATCRLPEELHLDEKCGNCRIIPKPSDPSFILQVVNEVLSSLQKSAATVLPPAFSSPKVFSHSSGLQLAVMMDLSYSMVAQRNPDQLLNTVTRAVRDIFHCSLSLMVIQTDSGGTRYYFGGVDSEPANFCPEGLLPPAELVKLAVDKRIPAHWRQTPGASRTSGTGPRSYQSLLVAPFASPSRVYGWISLMDKLDSTPFFKEEEEMVAMLSTQAALAYENILLIEQLQKSEIYLEELVARRTAELERAHKELFKVQKLESLGVLAGGIAHDFNNALSAIVNNIQIVKMKSDPGDIFFRNLHLAEKACYNAQSLTRQLLTFARGGSPLKKITELPVLLHDSVEFALRGSTIRCEFDLAPDLRAVEIDHGQISQVISNLVINAWQAMPGGGTIRIVAENVVLGSDSPLPLKEGEYVRVTIADQGVGIAEEDLHRIFDPYFTTKETGSGLGLTAAYSIVKNHDGYIMVESEKGVGTAFHIYLPVTDRPSAVEQEKEEMLTGGGRILLIEDQKPLAETVCELLGFYGFSVDCAQDGREGLKLYEKAMKSGQGYDAVIMDLTIPGGMGGKEAIKRLREIDTGVPAIVASGYSNDPVMSDYRAYGFDSAISKPYDIEDLVRELHRVITSSLRANCPGR